MYLSSCAYKRIYIYRDEIQFSKKSVAFDNNPSRIHVYVTIVFRRSGRDQPSSVSRDFHTARATTHPPYNNNLFCAWLVEGVCVCVFFFDRNFSISEAASVFLFSLAVLSSRTTAARSHSRAFDDTRASSGGRSYSDNDASARASFDVFSGIPHNNKSIIDCY